MSIAATTKKRNARFKRLSPAQKRVAVAKDVLKALDLEHYVAVRGTYINMHTADEASVLGARDARALQGAVKSVRDCYVCAVGAAALSCIRKFDGVSPGEYGDAHFMAKRVFPHEQLMSMEHAFESFEVRGFKQKTSDACLRAIFKNIVKNKGEFKP